MRQRAFVFRTHGGRRKGTGRKVAPGRRAGVSHKTRPALSSRFPVHVTLRMASRVWNLRSRRAWSRLSRAFGAAAERLGGRLVEVSVQGNHIHLLVEAVDRRALSRAVQGLSIRVAKKLNGMMRTRGRVLADRYHARILKTPTEVRHAVHYLRHNHQHHATSWGRPVPARFVDPFTSFARRDELSLPSPGTWLLSQALDAANQDRRT